MEKNPQKIGNVVQEFMIGATHVKICDDYCVSPEETKVILERIAARALEAYRAMPVEEFERVMKEYVPIDPKKSYITEMILDKTKKSNNTDKAV